MGSDERPVVGAGDASLHDQRFTLFVAQKD